MANLKILLKLCSRNLDEMRRQTVRQKTRRKLMMSQEQESDSALMMPAEPGMASAWSFEY